MALTGLLFFRLTIQAAWDGRKAGAQVVRPPDITFR